MKGRDTGKTGKTAVMIGAGNIGRGFIGAAFAASGYETVFIDIDRQLVNEINARGEYPVTRFAPDGKRTDACVRGARAVSADNIEAAAAEIAGADICATAVGKRALPLVAPMLAQGLALRAWLDNKAAENMQPLDILVCENMIDAGETLRRHTMDGLPKALRDPVSKNAGFPEAVIGRMVPIQTEEMKEGDPLRICVEEYGFIPVDKSSFRGEIPEIEGLVPLDNFRYYVKRKLFIHNLGHAAVGYLGLLGGYEYIADAADDPDIMYIAIGAMHESAAALFLENSADVANLSRNIASLAYRFTNRALGDTCARVSADPERKLGKRDRIIGALENCGRAGLPAVCIAAVAASAAHVLEMDYRGNAQAPSLAAVTGLPDDGEPGCMIKNLMAAFPPEAFGKKEALVALRRAAVKIAGDIEVI